MSELRSKRSLVPRALAVAACLVGGRALAAEEAAALPSFGVAVDAGVPDFLGLNGVYRPLPFLRVQAGLLYNGAGVGARGGVALVPFNWVVAPALTLEYGHFFASDVRGPLQSLGLSLGQAEQALANLSYGFANAHLGLEMGPAQRFQVSLRFGLSYLNTTLTGSGELLQQASGDPTIRAEDLRMQGVLPSLKLGFVYYFG